MSKRVYIYTTSFLIYCSNELLLSSKIINFRKNNIEFYSPFNTQLENYYFYPKLDLDKIPGIKNLKNQVRLIDPIILPSFDEAGKFRTLTGASSLNAKLENGFIANVFRFDLDPDIEPSVITEFLEILFNKIRLHTNQWWINAAFNGFSSFKQYYFDVSDEGKLVQFISSSPTFFTAPLPIKLLDNKTINTIFAEIENGTPDSGAFHKELLLESVKFLSLGKINECCLNIAIACEVRKELFYRSLYDGTRPYKRAFPASPLNNWTRIKQKKFKICVYDKASKTMEQGGEVNRLSSSKKGRLFASFQAIGHIPNEPVQMA